MNSISKIIIQELENLNTEIAQRLDSKDITNTGTAKNSLRVEQEKRGVNLNFRSVAIEYLEFLNKGRGPGKPPPMRNILLWASQKTGQPISKVWGLAKYVREKIAKEGTTIYNNNSKGIELEQLIQELETTLNKEIGVAAAFEIEQKLNKFRLLRK